jgi:arsenite methyltransferase
MTTSFAHDSAHLAATYDRLSNSQFESGKRLVDRLEIAEGAHVLDVGCGTGRLARFLAERVGSPGRVVGIDPLPDRIAIAREHGPGITFEVGQAEDLRAFADQTFDAVTLSSVFHWLSDKPKALGEVRRVLRPGGKLGVTTFPKELVATGTGAEVIASVIGRSPYVEKADFSAIPFANGGHTVTELIAMVLDSGLSLAELHVVERTRTHATGEDVVDFLESSSFGNFLRMVPEDMRPALRADLAAGFEARKGSTGVVMRDWGMVFVAKRG